MRILITGGRGYLGHALVRELTIAGHDLTLIARQSTEPQDGIRLIPADIRDVAQLRRALDGLRFDAVCHLAALTNARESTERPLEYWETNASGTINLLSAVSPEAAVVLASTASVYVGDADGALGEETPIAPRNPYAASKYAAEQILAAYAQTVGCASTVLRCFNIAGAVDGVGDHDPSRVIIAMFNAAVGRTPALVINGDGSAVRDYVHVADVASAFRLAVEASPNQTGHHVYNVGTGQGLTIAELLEAGRRVVGHDIMIRHDRPKLEADRLVANSSRITAQLQWRPNHSDAQTIVADAWEAFDRANISRAR